MAEAAAASGRARVERKAASTWYVRVTEADLSSPDGFPEALRFSRIALGLDERPAPEPRAVAEPPDARLAQPPQDTVLVLARAAWEELARGADVNLEPVGGTAWTWARLGMGPFPARLILDETGHQMHVDAVIGYATSTFRIEEVVNSIPVPPPVISYVLAPESLVSFRYSAPLGPVESRQAYLMLSTAVNYACMFSWSLYHDLTEATQELLGNAGFDLANGFPSPIQLLGTGAWRYEPWEAQPAPPPATFNP